VVWAGGGSIYGVDGADEFHDVERVCAELPGGGVKGCFVAREKRVPFAFAQGRLSRDGVMLRNDKFKNSLTAKVAKKSR